MQILEKNKLHQINRWLIEKNHTLQKQQNGTNHYVPFDSNSEC
jgi:hypothetical protein